jgi:hypothetical protein
MRTTPTLAALAGLVAATALAALAARNRHALLRRVGTRVVRVGR